MCLVSRYVCITFGGKSASFCATFWTAYRVWYFTLGRRTNLAGKQPWRLVLPGKRWWPHRGGSFVSVAFWRNLPHFGGLFGNTCRDGFYTLGWCTNLARKQPWKLVLPGKRWWPPRGAHSLHHWLVSEVRVDSKVLTGSSEVRWSFETLFCSLNKWSGRPI